MYVCMYVCMYYTLAYIGIISLSYILYEDNIVSGLRATSWHVWDKF